MQYSRQLTNLPKHSAAQHRLQSALPPLAVSSLISLARPSVASAPRPHPHPHSRSNQSRPAYHHYHPTIILQPWTPAHLLASFNPPPSCLRYPFLPSDRIILDDVYRSRRHILVDPTAAPTKDDIQKRHHRPSTHHLTLRYPTTTATPDQTCAVVASIIHPSPFVSPRLVNFNYFRCFQVLGSD